VRRFQHVEVRIVELLVLRRQIVVGGGYLGWIDRGNTRLGTLPHLHLLIAIYLMYEPRELLRHAHRLRLRRYLLDLE